MQVGKKKISAPRCCQLPVAQWANHMVAIRAKHAVAVSDVDTAWAKFPTQLQQDQCDPVSDTTLNTTQSHRPMYMCAARPHSSAPELPMAIAQCAHSIAYAVPYCAAKQTVSCAQ
jgi:hypothetical protein